MTTSNMMGHVDFRFLRPAKAALLKERYDLFGRNAAPLRCVAINDAIIVPPVPELWNEGVRECGVIDSSMHFVTESSQDVDNAKAISEYGKEAASSKAEDMTVMYAGYLNRHWGHFTVDCLSRLWAAIGSSWQFDKIVFCVEPGNLALPDGNVMECIKLLGMEDKLMLIDRPKRFRCIIVPEEGALSRHHFAQEPLAVYDRIAMNAAVGHDNGKLPEKIYMSRSRLKKAVKTEWDLKWFDDFFKNNGFTVIYPENIGIGELTRYLRNAREVAAMSGTLPHNMLFANSGQKLIIIEKYANINNYQPGIDMARELDVTYVDANALIWSVSPGGGPFILYPNRRFIDFAKDHCLSGAVPFTSPKLKGILKQYFSQFHRQYSRQWYMEAWLEEEIGLLREAYRESMDDFGQWVDGSSTLYPCDALSPLYLAKKLRSWLRK